MWREGRSRHFRTIRRGADAFKRKRSRRSAGASVPAEHTRSGGAAWNAVRKQPSPERRAGLLHRDAASMFPGPGCASLLVHGAE